MSGLVLAVGLTAVPALAEVPAGEFLKICRSGSAEEVRRALALGAGADGADEHGYTPLMAAASDGSGRAAAKAEILLKAGADPNPVNRQKASALHPAAGRGDVELVKMLLAAGAEVNVYDLRGFTPLMEACRPMPNRPDEAVVPTLKLLLAAGADPTPGTNAEYGVTAPPPLGLAAHHAGPGAVELLLAAGCPVDGLTYTRHLMIAAQLNAHPETVAALLKAGADVGRTDALKETALDKARRNSTPAAGAIIRLLEAARK